MPMSRTRLLAMTALGDPTTSGRILSTIATRAQGELDRALLLPHPATAPDICAGMTIEDCAVIAWCLCRPVATPATRQRLLAAATDAAMYGLTFERTAYGPDIAMALAARYQEWPADDTHRLHRATVTRCRPSEHLMPQCGAKDLATVARWVSRRARWRGMGDHADLTHMARVFVHPNTPAPARQTVLRGMRRIADNAEYVSPHGWRQSTNHIAHTLALHPDLTDLPCTRPLPDLQRWAHWDEDVAYALTHHATPLLRPLWEDPDAASAALALEGTFPGTLPEMLRTAYAVAA